MQRLAEKVHRDCRTSEDHLDDIERRIIEEERRIERVHPMEAKRSCEKIQGALQMLEGNIQNVFSDVQALKDGKFHQSEQLYRRWVS